ncbi:MAG: hypothetical protein CTY34_06585 [Methylobacter sp.]|nr:MAG: hypothetical protein CTY34_06585 [Methylobacter sp.]PPD24241.1 MAG: hypothetical protein CTY24_01730 [Methylobacter sp.]PPD37608.1 MAG: hypothetical protein CTY18_01470 [Methylomonas sp.]
MTIKKDLEDLMDKLKTERDELQLKLHLASLDAKAEFESAEQQWELVKAKALEIADESMDASEDLLGKAKMVAEELKDTYSRISKRLSE